MATKHSLRSFILLAGMLSLPFLCGQALAVEPNSPGSSATPAAPLTVTSTSTTTGATNTTGNPAGNATGTAPSEAPARSGGGDAPAEPSPGKPGAETSTTERLSARARDVLGRLGGYTRNAQDIITSGFAYLGVEYRRGGTGPSTGFDCSGLVRRVFDDAFGMELPHNARAISKEGAMVSIKDLRPGDLVFFNTLRKTFSHVGIYVGNNLFLHAPSAGSSVRLEDLREHYWVKHFDGARRLSIH